MLVKLQPVSPLLGTEIPLPDYATAGAAAMDVRACITRAVTLPPGESALIPTGFCLEVPTGFAAFLFARSGLASREGICLANSVGVIDSDYRGEVCVALRNLSPRPYTVQPGERIAQMAFLPVEHAAVQVTQVLSDTARGGGGFGSTGKQ